ncbi:hypothetical protein GCM10010218_37480 [Streptomyces mashuensis]|uniref:Bacterial transcriptional activator domain-containing protein n=1 Tax=Streptomyces mashuensis TaxID=33904 RepID=A0A919B5Q7_9ACTN|nr:AfsR/SARP family transcriptional regulator [Streptomyces mashuensis]GHF52508.1 hypothetical protein GCM10010218_37480 [Streptomyces mashuensis]
MIFGVLGPVGIWSDDARAERLAEAQLSEHRTRGALAALLLRPNQYITQSALADLLWDDPPPSARPNLRAHAARLRKALLAADPREQRLKSLRRGGDWTGGAYLLVVRPLEVDADVFLRLLARARGDALAGRHAEAVAGLRQALGLWRGEAGGTDVAGSTRLLAQLRSFNDLRITAQEDLMAARLRLGEHRVLIPQIRSVLADHPHREIAWSQLMYAYYRCGDMANALRTYQEAHTVLDRELGVQPGDGLQQLHHAMLNRDDDLVLRTLEMT